MPTAARAHLKPFKAQVLRELHALHPRAPVATVHKFGRSTIRGDLGQVTAIRMA